MSTDQPESRAIDSPRRSAPGTDAARQLVLGLLSEHGDVLWSYCRARVGSDEAAEDVVQETLLAALGSASKFQGASSTLTWLLGIASHKVADHFRRVQRSARERAADAGDEDTDPSPVAWFSERGNWAVSPAKWSSADPHKDEDAAKALRQCLDRLPPGQAELVWLRDVLDMPSQAICEALSLTATNLWTRMHRARTALRACIERSVAERGRQQR